jgi:hypothetical protein
MWLNFYAAFSLQYLVAATIAEHPIAASVTETSHGFLKPHQTDVLALVGGIGSILTAIGVLLAVWQMYRTTSANRAATEAAIAALNTSRRQYDRYVIHHASRIVAEARLFVQHDDFNIAAVRLQDLAELITQVSGADQEWDGLALRLRQMQHSFNRIGKGEIKFPSVRSKWVELEQAVGQKLGTQIGPFPKIDQGKTQQ